MRSVRVGGVRIAFETAGSGPPLLLLHGLLADGRTWAHESERLSDRWTVVAWDIPGCGRSGDPPAGAGMAEHGQLLIGFVEALGLDRPHILGLSWGAVLALELLRQRPSIARSLVLAAAYAGWTGSLPPQVVAARLDAALIAIQTTDARSVVGTWLPTLLSPAAPAATVNHLSRMMADFHRDAAQDMLRAIASADFRSVLPTITAPTLLIHGSHDTRSPLPVVHTLQQAIPGARLEVIDEVGHMLHLEAPERFQASVATFLASVDSSNAAAAFA